MHTAHQPLHSNRDLTHDTAGDARYEDTWIAEVTLVHAVDKSFKYAMKLKVCTVALPSTYSTSTSHIVSHCLVGTAAISKPVSCGSRPTQPSSHTGSVGTTRSVWLGMLAASLAKLHLTRHCGASCQRAESMQQVLEQRRAREAEVVAAAHDAWRQRKRPKVIGRKLTPEESKCSQVVPHGQ